MTCVALMFLSLMLLSYLKIGGSVLHPLLDKRLPFRVHPLSTLQVYCQQIFEGLLHMILSLVVIPLELGGVQGDLSLQYQGLEVVGTELQADRTADDHAARSEERRVGEECRSRWSPDH